MRELEAVLEQAVIFRGGDWITAEDLDLPMPWIAEAAENGAGAEHPGTPDAEAALSWLQHEAMRIAAKRRVLRRRELVARFRVSREVARRELAGLVRLGLLRLAGRGRARYVPLSVVLIFIRGTAEWTMALV